MCSFYFIMAVFVLCFEGTTEKRCSETSCCAGYMFDSSKNCVVCPNGLHGFHCSAPCPRGYYGKRCALQCECPDEFCNATVGCVLKKECLPGYSGENCSTNCPRGYYGNHCINRCECPDELCNATTGCVSEKVCPPGYMRVNCSTACPRGFYGNECGEHCNCSEEFCNATFGCIEGDGHIYFDPITLPTIILTTVGLVILFVPFGTIIAYKMKKNTEHKITQTKFIPSSSEDARTYFELRTPAIS